MVSRRKMIPTYITIIISLFSTFKCVWQEPLACKQGLFGMDGNDWSQACGLISDIKTWIHRKQGLVDDIYHPRCKQSSILLAIALILEKWKARNCSKYGFERGVSSGVGGIVGRKWRDLECDALRSRGRRDQRYHPSSLGELPRSSESPFYVTFCLRWKLCQVKC